MAANAAKSLTRLRIVNLPWTVADQQLKQYFSQFGYIAKAKVVFDKRTGFSKNFGFIEIPDKDTYNTIINKSNHILEGYDIHVKNYFVVNEE